MPTRRQFIQGGAIAVTAVVSGPAAEHTAAAASEGSVPAPHPLLTPANEFRDVSRGNPKPHTLTGEDLVQARLTPDTWRLEIIADPFTSDVVKEPANVEKQFTLADGTALDLPALIGLGETCGVRYLKAVQCLNIAEPLGQGLWEGVPLRDVLRLCGALQNVRRIFYHGFHNNDPQQLFQSSLSYAQAMENAPGDPPVFLAYKLNGDPIPLSRGGPVRMIVPWAYGFKSIKWLQRISLTNDYQANDTYAKQNNDPDSPMKTAAYLDKLPNQFPVGRTIYVSGRVISGFSGLERVEAWLHRMEPGKPPVVYDDVVYRAAEWTACLLEPEPSDWRHVLPGEISPAEVLGFDPNTKRARTWPLRYGMASWSLALRDLEAGQYELHVRAVDLNGYAQPEPRPMLKAGKNAVEVYRFEVS
ncbi:MAG: molybdopterin-dependent oxidoreductase [bacterium]|nr:molybdopterin-dependent oxidoreductase [bacterium]